MCHHGLKSNEKTWKYASIMPLIIYVSFTKKHTQEVA